MSDVTMNIRGAKIPVGIISEDDPDFYKRGQLQATIDDETFRANTWGELRALLYGATEEEIPVPFVYVRSKPGKNDGQYLLNGVTRRIHASQPGTTLVTWPSGAKDAVGYGDTVLSPPDDSDRAELERLLAVKTKTDNRIDQLLTKYRISLPEAVRAAKAESVAKRAGQQT